MKDDFIVEEVDNSYNAKIVVIGVGGGGQNMVDELLKSGISDDVKLVVANADKQALDKSNIPNKIQLGPNTTRGLGCGMDPEVGKKAAIESIDDIREALKV